MTTLISLITDWVERAHSMQSNLLQGNVGRHHLRWFRPQSKILELKYLKLPTLCTPPTRWRYWWGKCPHYWNTDRCKMVQSPSQMSGVQKEVNIKTHYFIFVIGQRCPRLVELNAIKCKVGKWNWNNSRIYVLMLAPAYQVDALNTVVQRYAIGLKVSACFMWYEQ